MTEVQNKQLLKKLIKSYKNLIFFWFFLFFFSRCYDIPCVFYT